MAKWTRKNYDPAAAEEKKQEALDTLTAGIKSLMTSEEYAAYLRTMAKFYRYSFNNSMLIHFQAMMRGLPLSFVAGYDRWQELGYQVRKGEKRLTILAPVIKKYEDEETGDVDRKLVGFRLSGVFALAQTDPIEGKAQPLDTLNVTPLTTNSDLGAELLAILKLTAATLGCTVEYGDTGHANGFYRPSDKVIRLSDALAVDMQAKTLAHEVAHHLTPAVAEMSKEDREAIAESAAFVALSHYGIDTSGYTFGYVAGWVQDIKIFERNLKAIAAVSKSLIDALSASLPEEEETIAA